MATLADNAHTTAERAWGIVDQAMETAISGREFRHPSGTVFVPGDVVDRAAAVARYAGEGKRVVMVRGDGSEELIRGGRSRDAWPVVIGLALVLGWLAGRRGWQ